MTSPEERQVVTEAIGKRIVSISRSVNKENLEWMKKWDTEIAPKIKKETPENYAIKLEEIVHGIWTLIFVEYPDSVKENGQKQFISSLSGQRLERNIGKANKKPLIQGKLGKNSSA